MCQALSQCIEVGDAAGLHHQFQPAFAIFERIQREAIIGRVEMGYSYEELAVVLDKPSSDAARMAVARAVRRLAGGGQAADES